MKNDPSRPRLAEADNEKLKINLKLLMIFQAVAGLLFINLISAEAVTQPHLKRVGPSLLVNPNIGGVSNWELNHFGGTGQDAQYDPNISRTADGSGSLKISAPGAQAYSTLMPVTPGKSYTFAAYMKTSEWPARAYPIFQVFKIDPNNPSNVLWDRNAGVGSLYANTAANEWREAAGFYTALQGDAYARVGFGRDSDWLIKNHPLGDIWVDDFYFGEGQGFEQPPAEKRTFNGSSVRIDELGNFEVYKNNAWQPFFPLGIFYENSRDLSFYSQQGFNFAVWCPNADCVQAAKNAVSDFNPGGMMAGLSIAQYIAESGGWDPALYSNLADLGQRINEIKNGNLAENLLYYYWDNEGQELEEFDVSQAVTDVIKEKDLDANGTRMHPIYMNQGNNGLDRMYQNMVDTVGDYAYDGYNNFYSISENMQALGFRFKLVQNIEKQALPLSVCGINTVKNAALMRMVVYKSLICGCKGISYWMDGGANAALDSLTPPIETLGWWQEFPQLRRELDQLIPLIRRPHWTDWKLSSSDNSIVHGVRDYNNEGYVMLVNPNNSAKTTTFTVSGLSYGVSTIKDYFTNTEVASVSNNSFTVTLPAYATKVYKLANTSTSVVDINQDGSVNSTDFNILKTDFLKLTANLTNPKSDIDGDGQATVKDVGILMSGWKP